MIMGSWCLTRPQSNMIMEMPAPGDDGSVTGVTEP
jgi:hypothetical protein